MMLMVHCHLEKVQSIHSSSWHSPCYKQMFPCCSNVVTTNEITSWSSVLLELSLSSSLLFLCLWAGQLPHRYHHVHSSFLSFCISEIASVTTHYQKSFIVIKISNSAIIWNKKSQIFLHFTTFTHTVAHYNKWVTLWFMFVSCFHQVKIIITAFSYHFIIQIMIMKNYYPSYIITEEFVM